jgi:hypothetical protein
MWTRKPETILMASTVLASLVAMDVCAYVLPSGRQQIIKIIAIFINAPV